MKTIVKIFYPNQNGKIELTKEELESLLDSIRKEAYDEGYAEGRKNNNLQPYFPNTTPYTPILYNKDTPLWNPYEITCTNLAITKEGEAKHETLNNDN